MYGSVDDNEDINDQQKTAAARPVITTVEDQPKKSLLIVKAVWAFIVFVVLFSVSRMIYVNLVTGSYYSTLHTVQTSFDSNNFMESLPPKSFQKLNKNDAAASSSSSKIIINTARVYQTISGFGGAFTEAASLAFASVPLPVQEKILTLYFKNASYTFGRVPINSCDFSPESYNFCNVSNDLSLQSFDTNVTHDTKAIIPFIKAALRTQPQLKLYAAPWSPPGWMKVSDSNNTHDMLRSASPNGLRPSCQPSWALYIIKWLRAYKNSHGINFWGLSVQNEPMFNAPWEACIYTPEYMASFVADFLGPILSTEFPQTALMIYDHNKPGLFNFVSNFMKNTVAASFVKGIAFHWYSDTGSRMLDGASGSEFVNHTATVFSDKFILGTEGCNCPAVASTSTLKWFRAQRYAHDILSDLNSMSIGWVDWNLLLDSNGGPNHLGNTCDAPIVLNDAGDDIVIQPSYYYMRHISSYVRPGSKRVGLINNARFASRHGGGYATTGVRGELETELIMNQYTAGLHNCENSLRSGEWTLLPNASLSTSNGYCLTNVDGNNVEMWKCWGTTTQQWEFDGKLLRNFQDKSKCLSSDGTTADGIKSANVYMQSCDTLNKFHQWTFEDGEIKPAKTTSSTNNLCLTAGPYPLVQASAFVTPAGQRVVVVLNENNYPLEDLELQDSESSQSVTVSVPANGISTFTWE